ncbi:type II toxin-antitoxin system RelE/ParE family toxin [Candidatus Microgenomates bacterium]|nr:type II toxin-antitoxin system RelE/ParE family toxin [Candidatus Microgenomates bacterium]
MVKVILTPQAQRDLRKIPKKDKLKIRQKLKLLEDDPFEGKKLGGKLKKLYSLRIWPYRAIYLIKKNKEVWIIYIQHRQRVYK